MDGTLQFDYTFHHGQHHGYYTSCGNEVDPLWLSPLPAFWLVSKSVEDSGGAKDGPLVLPFGLPSDPAPVQFSREGCSYPPLDAPVSQEHMDSTYWTGLELGEGPSDILRLHAPIPVSGCAPILRSSSCCPEDYTVVEPRTSNPHLPMQPSIGFQPEYPQVQRYNHTGASCLPSSNVAMPLTFPTPSELLVELYTQENQSQQAPHPSFRQERYSSTRIMNKPHRPLPARSTRNAIEPASDASLLASSDSTSESITSHEKKRHYLECLEHYVGFLHDHFRHNSIKPASLERISSYRCLSSRSIRVSEI